MQEKTILIPIYAGVTQLDFTGPHQFFARTPGLRPVVASLDGEPIDSHGLAFAGLADLGEVEACDVLCVPGGTGCLDAAEDERFLDAIRRLGGSAEYLTSVCTGSLILGAAGLIVGRRAACHWAWRDLLSEFGAVPDDGRVVRDGNLITGGGVTAGIDFALTVIAELQGPEVAQAVQLGLEYAPDPPFRAGRPELASQPVLSAVEAVLEPDLEHRRNQARRLADRAAAGAQSEPGGQL